MPGGADGVAVVSLDAVGRSWLDAGGMIASMEGDGIGFAAVLLLDRAKMSRNGVADRGGHGPDRPPACSRRTVCSPPVGRR